MNRKWNSFKNIPGGENGNKEEEASKVLRMREGLCARAPTCFFFFFNVYLFLRERGRA